MKFGWCSPNCYGIPTVGGVGGLSWKLSLVSS